MKKFLSILLIFSFLFPQEICEGQCYTDEEAQNIELYITGLEQNSSKDSLIIPHARLHERVFVLQPMMQIAPHFMHPVFQKTIKELYLEQNDHTD